jgi:hypothetical protein
MRYPRSFFVPFEILDSRLRGNDEEEGVCVTPSDGTAMPFRCPPWRDAALLAQGGSARA